MPIGTIVGAVAGIGSGILGYMGAKKAAAAQTAAADKAAALQEKFFNISRGDLASYRTVGGGALRSLGDLYGIGANGKPTGKPFPQASLDAFTKSPDYQFALQEGLKSVEQSRAARGSLHSGGTMAELQERGSGIAAQNFGNYVSRLLQLAGIGENAAAQSGNNAMSAGTNMGNIAMARGEAEASGTVGGYNALGQGLSGAFNNLSLYKLTNPSTSAYGGGLSSYAANATQGTGGLW